MSVSDVPLLNDYKKEFVKRRLPQSFLGGPNLKLGFAAPCYAYTFQILVFLFPWLIGGTFTIITEIVGVSILISAILAGVFVGVFVFVIQIVHLCKSKNREGKNEVKTNLTASQQLRHLLAQDDDIIFESPFSYNTFKFIFPPLRYRPAILYHGLFSGVLCGVGVWYTLPSVLSSLYQNNVAVTVVVYIFSWIAICIAQYSLNAGGVPPEVATFYSIDSYDVASLSRTFHIFVFFAFHILQLYIPSFLAVNQVLHIVLLFLPIFWFFGLLPPFDSFFIWIAEQVLVFCLGGSPCATDLRLCLSLILSVTVLIGASFLSNVDALVGYSAGFGYILSTDIVSLLAIIFSQICCCSVGISKKKRIFNSPHFYLSKSFPNLFVHAITSIFLAVVIVIGIVLKEEAVDNGVVIVLEYFFIVAFVIVKILQDTQRVYIIFRFFRNCVYPYGYAHMNNLKTRKMPLRVCGYIYSLLVSFLNALLMSLYMLWIHDTQENALPSFILALGFVHAFRMIWQRSNSALVSFVVISIARLLFGFAGISIGSFSLLPIGSQLLIVDICMDRVYKFINNLWFAVALIIASWTDKKQRRKLSLLLLISNIVLFPLIMVIIGIASALAAPVLSLFTLPIFLVGFPRPSRFWPQRPGSVSPSICADTSYYEGMAPGLSTAMAKGIRSGKYGMLLGQGTDLPFYIARSQDKTFWIQVLETGYGYVTLSIKGLELQETSCHALEATRLDDALSVAFEKPDQSSCCRANPYPFLYSVTPIDTEFIDGYSDAKNSLSGIIDRPDSIKCFQKDFAKILVWLMVHTLCKKKSLRVFDFQIAEEDTPGTIKRLSPSSVKSNKVIPLTTINANSNKQAEKLKSPITAWNLNPTASPSASSLSSILGSDNETPRKKQKHTYKTKVFQLPGSSEQPNDTWEIGSDISGDSGFGVSVKNFFSKSSNASTIKENGKKPFQKNLSLPNGNDVTGWGPTPLSESDLAPHKRLFDKSWYLYVASLLDEAEWGSEEDHLMKACHDTVVTCFVIAFVQSLPGGDLSSLGFPNHITKIFNGVVPWSINLDWLTSKKDLYSIFLVAHRYAVKMMYDRVAMATIDDAEKESHEEYITTLKELVSDWHIGPEGDRNWKEAITEGIPSLFSISYDSNKKEYSARVLIQRPLETHVCRASSAAVRSIWANLSVELLYATNDDEERYSIQAHPNIIRNLTVQAADPPLGYPIYSSHPIYASLFGEAPRP